MKTRILFLLAVIAAAGATPVVAQAHGPAADRLTIGLYGGGYTPASTLMPGVEFENSGTVGGTLTLWLHPLLGVRGNVLYARTNVSLGGPASLAGEDPNVWAYSGDLLLRHPKPIGTGHGMWFPYLVGGLGGKTYDFDQQRRETDLAGNYGAGVEFRNGRWGVQAEVRDIVSNFDRLGVDKTQHDVVWTAGLTWTF